MEYGDASGTGLMDIRRLRWDEGAAAAVDPDLAAKLPPLSHPREPVGPMKKPVAARFGFGRVLVASGGGDNMMGAIGTGNVTPGVCTLSLGTSGTVYSHFDRPFVDPAGRDRGLLRQHGRLAAAALHDERHQHDRDRQVALQARQRQARAAGAAGRAGRGRAHLPAVRRRRAGARPPLLERRSLRPRPADVRRRAHRPVGHGGHGPQPGLRFRPHAGARPEAGRDPGDRGRREEPALAPDRRRRLRRRRS